MEKKIIPPTNQDISWSGTEQNAWVEAGLISQNLLLPEKIRELAQFVLKNKAMLYEYYHDKPEEYPYQVEIPTSRQEMENAYELRIVDKATGKTVKILDRVESVELCEGLSLRVNAKEAENWRKKTEPLKQLSKEQTIKFKSILEKISTSRKDIGIDQLVNIIDDLIKLTKPSTYSMSGHLVDQKIPTKEKISIPTESTSEIKVHGLRGLSAGKHRIFKTLGLLLHQKKDGPQIQSMPDIPNGKLLTNVILNNSYGYPPSIIIIDEKDYYKAYWGDTSYGGSDKKRMEKDLKDFSREVFSINYQQIYKEKGSEKVNLINFESSMVEVYNFYQGLTPDEADRISSGKKGIKRSKLKKILIINQIFTHQIENKFINYPFDINKQMATAAGGGRAVTPGMHILLDYLLREMSYKRWGNEINEAKLIALLEFTNKKRRKGRLREDIKKCFDAIKNIGILLEVVRLKNKDGSYKYKWKLDSKFSW